jgi:hypothetical protein
LARASAAQPRRDRRSAVLVFSAVLHRDREFLQFRSARFLREDDREFIGWEDSPFQLEVGFASLGFAAVGLLAFKGGFDMRLAAVVGPACFLWGAAAGHVYQMITAHNFAAGNAGVIFYSDILVPLIGFLFLWLQRSLAAPAQGKMALR